MNTVPTSKLLICLLALFFALFGNSPSFEPASGEEGKPTSPLTITFIDVGQGDSILIECPRGQRVLIDGGPKKAGPKVTTYLKEKGISKLDLLIATHPDADHIGGLLAIIKAFPVDLFIDPGKSHTTYLYRELLALIKKKGIVYKLGRAFDIYKFGDVKLEILHPTDKLPDDNNESSVVAKVSLGNVSVMLTGDAEGEAEEAMIERGHNLKCQILKAGHHGNRNSTSYIFLEKVRPDATIFSCGRNNKYGHPDPETIRAVKFFRSQIYRTDESGNIELRTDGNNYSLWTEKEWQYYRQLARAGGPSSKLNINRATLEELTHIPFLSDPQAQLIIQYRDLVEPFEKTEELLKIPGIGPFIYEKIKPCVTVN